MSDSMNIQEDYTCLSPLFLLADHKPDTDFTKIKWDQQQAVEHLLLKVQDFTVIFLPWLLEIASIFLLTVKYYFAYSALLKANI